jgi:hypothetical protein
VSSKIVAGLCMRFQIDKAHLRVFVAVLVMRSLTVEECCVACSVADAARYSAALRLDPSLAPAAVSARVDDVMARLWLPHVA